MSVSMTVKVKPTSQIEVGPGWVDVVEPNEISGGTIAALAPEDLERLASKLKAAAALLRTREQGAR